MLKVMIAEDEAIERKALNFLLDRYFSDRIKVIYQAKNGREVMDNFDKYTPDLILMDIHMPGIDGLSVAEYIKSRLPHVEIIILTAYGYFEYAKKAISIGIFEYLLKPYSDEDFCKVMSKAIEKLIKQKEMMDYQKMLTDRLKGIVGILEKEIIFKMLCARDSKNKMLEYKKILNIKSDKFCCLIIESTDKNKYFTGENLDFIKQKLKFLISEVIGKVHLNLMVLILFDNNLSEIIRSQKFESLLKEIFNACSNLCKVEVSFGIGNVYEELADMYQSYREAKSELNFNYSVNINNSINGEIFRLEGIISEKILGDDHEGAISNLRKLMDNLLNENIGNSIESLKNYIRQFLIYLNHNVIQFFGHSYISLDILQIENELMDITTITELQFFIEEVIGELFQRINEHKKDRNVQIIEMVKDYIQKNYMKDLCLDHVAEYISFSPYYLSKLFKKTEGVNFKEYLTRIRMEKAKEMIQKTQKSFSQIAVEVGYPDPNYFSRVFKKYTGKSPKEFANR